LDYYYIIYGKGQAQVLAAPEVVGAADNEWWHRHRHLFFPCSTLVFFLPEFSSFFFVGLKWQADMQSAQGSLPFGRL